MNFKDQKIDLSTVEFTPNLLRNLPSYLAQRHRTLPIFSDGDSLVIALAEPVDREAVGSLTNHLHRHLDVRAADGEQLDRFIQRFYGNQQK
jgi:type IV pilus assembly protein PilB